MAKHDVGAVAEKLLEEATKFIIENAPHAKEFIGEVIEYIFVPRAVARQLALAILLESGVVTINQVYAIANNIYCNFSSRSRLISQLEDKQLYADSQDEWMDLAEQIDNIQGNDIWRTEINCPLYESDRISSRIDEFVHLMRRRDVFDLMFTLRGGIARNKFGLLHEGLFSRALAGTKVLVETYHNIVCTSLEFVCDSVNLPGEEAIPTEAKLAFFNETRHMYGRTALMLSGGAALGFYHVGVVKALMLNGLLPRVISGASAGSIVAAMVSTRTDEECQRDLYNTLGTNAPGHYGKLMINFFRPMPRKIAKITHSNPYRKENPIKEVFHNDAGAFADKKKTWQLLLPLGIRNFTSSLYDVLAGHKRAKDIIKNDTEHFRQCCRVNIGDFTFQEAFDRTGRILNIIVSPQNRSDPPVLLNYLTAPHVVVWSAAVASSSLPGVFEPNRLLMKDPDGTIRSESANVSNFIDGSMEQDLPMQQLSEMFNINHFIISQTNPHAHLLASFSVNNTVWSNRVMGFVKGVVMFIKKQVKGWLENIIETIGGQRIAPTWDTRRGFISQFVTQEYEGREIDISLVPWRNHRSVFSALLHVIYNPSFEEMNEWNEASERETWRYIPKIKSHVAVEMMLDRCVQRLRTRLMAEKRESSRNMLSDKERMSSRVPSFFTSASLVNMSGLGVTDRANVDEIDQQSVHSQNSGRTPIPIGDEAPSGWNGMGLRGNFSSGNLIRSTSGTSGLFPMDDAGDETGFHRQEPGELSVNVRAVDNPQIAAETGYTKAPIMMADGYIKTTSMADFYYRHSSKGSLPGISDGGNQGVANHDDETV